MRKTSILPIFLACLIFNTGPGHATQQTIKQAVVSSDFVLWKPETATFQYSSLVPAEARLKDLIAEDDSVFFATYQAHVHFRSNGDVAETIVSTRYFPSETATRNYGNLSRWVDAFSQIATVQQAYTLLPDGERITVDPNTIQLIADTQDDIFTDSFKMVVPYPGLEPGAIAVMKTEIIHKADKSILPWSSSYYPKIFVPIESFRVTLRWDEGQSAPHWKTDFKELRCSTPQEREIDCHTEKVSPHKDDPDLRYYDVLPMLVVSKAESWENLIGTYNGHFNANLSGNRDIEEILKRLLLGATTDEEKLDRIHRFVSQKIRYLGLEHGLGGIVPRPSALTLERRFGDCKDKTALFVDLALRAGFDAYPVLTSTNRYAPNKLMLPAAHYFNHMVGCAKLPTGKEFCVDLTDPYSSYKLSSLTFNGAIRLDLIPQTKLPHSFETPRFYRSKNVKTINRFSPDGTVAEEQTLSYSGPNVAGLRARTSATSPKERQRQALEQYHNYISNKVDPIYTFKGLDDVKTPLIVHSKTEHKITDSLQKLNSYSEADGWLDKEISTAQTMNENHDYHFRGTHFRSEVVGVLPEEFSVPYTGPKLNLTSEFGSLQRSYEISQGEYRVITELSLPSGTIPLVRIPAFNKFLNHLRQNSKIWVALSHSEEE